MRAQAQGTSSAANSDGSAPRGSVFGRIFAATRASSLSAGGSGAPSHRRSPRTRVSALALAVAALALLAFAPLAGAKEVTKFFGTQAGSGSFGGEFNSPRDIAVNTRGVGAPQGTTYVADDANHRIQRFDRNNRFVSAWGKDVIASSVNERQRLVIDATAGTYQLTFNGVTTAPIDLRDGAGNPLEAFDLDNILNALSSIGGDANVAVTGSGTSINPFVVTFQGALAAADQPQMTVDTSQLEGTVRIATIADGDATTSSTGTAFEICTVATECKVGVASGGDGTAAGNGTLSAPQSVAVDNDTGNVYVSDRDNRRINAYDASGNFLFSVGRDVRDPDGGTAVEICTGGVDTCRAGDTGTSAGEIATTSTAGTLGIAVSPPDGVGATGSVYLADSANQRIQQFDLAGNFTAVHGFAVADGGAEGTGTVTVGSRSVSAVVTTRKAFVVGQTITGTGIDPGTTITAVGAGTITLSIAANAGALGAGTALSVVEASGNVPTNEQQTVTLGANTTGGTFTLTYTTPNPSNTTRTTAAIPYDAPATGVGSVQEALEALTNIGAGNVSVSGTGGAGGVYTITFQGTRFADTNVTQMTSSATGLTVSSGAKSAAVATTVQGALAPESCATLSPGACRAGIAGSGLGQFASGFPRRVAVDSRGILYASDSSNSGELDRFDSLNANGGGRAFLASIPSSVNEVQQLNFPGFFQNWDIGHDTFRLTCPNGVQTDEITVFASGDDHLRALQAACGNNFISSGGVGPSNAQITFINAFGGRDVPQMDCTPVSTEFGTCSVTTVTQGRSSTLIAGSTAGLAVDPDSDGVGADEDALYTLRAFSADPGTGAVQQFGPVNDPGLVAAPSVADAVHGGAAGFSNSVAGLGLDDVSGQLFVSTTNSGFGRAPAGGITGDGHRVYVLGDPLPAPGMVLNPVTTKTDATATFSASVDPRGGLIRCAFEYSTDPGFSTTADVAAPGCNSFSIDGGYQAVSQRATGLDANTRYFVRLVVTRTFDTSAVATSAPTDFRTDSVPPVVSNVGALQVQDTSARLVGTIDPKNSATGYIFQYGTTPALGSSTAPVNIGAGARAIVVSQLVTGLAKDTDHFFRLVATNEFGTTNGATKPFHTRAVPLPSDPAACANDDIREAQGSTHLPDCRAYEQVSPADKNQGGVDQYPLDNRIGDFSRDGNGALFCTSALFGEPTGQQTIACAPYVSRRTAQGWTTDNVFPPYCRFDFDGPKNTFGSLMAYLSPNFERAVLLVPESESCSIDPLDPAAPLPARNVYLQDLSADPFSFDLLAPNPNVDPSVSKISDLALAGSEDFGTIVYSSDVSQTLDSPAGSFDKLYVWRGGALSLLSRDPAGDPFVTASNLPPLIGSSFRASATTDVFAGVAVSDDGDRAYFHNSGRLYLRENATELQSPVAGGECTDTDLACTYEVSATECTSSCGADISPERFVWASPDGDRAFFHSSDKLTDESAAAAGKLYRWDFDGAEGDRLLDITIDREPADGVAPGADSFLLGMSSDENAAPGSDAAPGNTVYFVARGQLIAGEPTRTGFRTGLTDNLKIYHWTWNGGSPETEYLGPYVEPDGGVFPGSMNVHSQWGRVTPDGRYLALISPVALDPVADQDPDSPTDLQPDLYRWGGAEGWTCVSCQEPGAPAAGGVFGETVYSFGLDGFSQISGVSEPVPLISDDGKRLVFQTPEALLPQDTNGESGCSPTFGTSLRYPCDDVYEWNDGRLSLISPGTGERSIAIGATHDGESIFFMTRNKLVGWDGDDGTDIYVARMDGGFPEPAPAPPGCDLEAGACEGPGTAAQNISGAGSRAFEGAVNPPIREPSRRCPRGKRRVTRNGRTRCVPKRQKRHQNRAAKHNRRAAR